MSYSAKSISGVSNLLVVALLVLILLLAGVVPDVENPFAAIWAAGPPEEPILRIETGMHTAKINRIDTDRQGGTLLTCSVDKTLRLWDLKSGKLEKTLRVPIDRGKDGKL